MNRALGYEVPDDESSGIRLIDTPIDGEQPLPQETTIRFIEGEGGCSVLEVETSDRSGFVRCLSQALIQESVEIVQAEVRRVSGGVQDRFVITEHDGSPIGAAKRLALQVAVLSAVDRTS